MARSHVLAIALVTAILAGCTNNPSAPSDQSLAGFTVSPGDGENNVRLDAALLLTFDVSVNRAVVEQNLYLVSDRMLPDSLCPDSTMSPHGGMGTVMMDSLMMNHLGRVHATAGRFLWNENSTFCRFVPDSMLTPRTQYMMYVRSQMMEMLRQRMPGMNTMPGHGSGMRENGMVMHFVTMDTTGTGGGHGHH